MNSSILSKLCRKFWRSVQSWLGSVPDTNGPAQLEASLFNSLVRNATDIQRSAEFKNIAEKKTSASVSDVRLIAYYLPQFHPIPQNDEWWGKGFTEWRNVTRALPAFEGHYQPRLPGELGYYDLRVSEVMQRQVALAQLYGISGFCFHFYWFAGQRLLELPVVNYLADKSLALPFSLCWANENWSRRWTGGEADVLIGQEHSPEDDISFINYLDQYFRDERYIKINGKPLLTVYRPELLPDAAATVARWRSEIVKLGYPGIYLVATNAFDFKDYRRFSFDALSEFPPHGVTAPNIRSHLRFAEFASAFRVREFAKVVESEKSKRVADGVVHPGVMPSWDNSARRPAAGHVFHGSSPALFADWLKHAIERATKNPKSEQMVFINAWNEWAEGAYLEPDQRFGYAYLEACARVLRNEDDIQSD